MPENNSQTRGLNKIRIITNVLTTALKLWLRSQVSQISDLEVEIKASDRQLLSGCIPWVSIFASHAIYQGLHITQIKLAAENIQINIGQVLKGQPLQLLQVVPVSGELIIDETDLNTSLSSGLLSTALNDVLDKLLPEYWSKSKHILWQKIILDHQQIKLNAILTSASEPIPLEICLHLDLLSGQELQLSQIRVQQNQVTLLEDSDPHNVDLGSDVDIQELKLTPGQLVCRGQVNVNP
ncbi:DUF2993 domain-containing protein [Nostoc parmelioides]|uniref:DUF2993 domain-containing protein n=1 Tax=Nostoc parmelioides FACHB-3921 TaxID=2692909 RepID=A0ABR8BFV6_9NOSO|nr:DUF2993 domain-containing protein [Nostoc parmelioides]MBD2251858.1 DUF2993 domain-containing protein [Nostoc parmelioides FACHB-3921]